MRGKLGKKINLPGKKRETWFQEKEGVGEITQVFDLSFHEYQNPVFCFFFQGLVNWDGVREESILGWLEGSKKMSHVYLRISV